MFSFFKKHIQKYVGKKKNHEKLYLPGEREKVNVVRSYQLGYLSEKDIEIPCITFASFQKVCNYFKRKRGQKKNTS